MPFRILSLLLCLLIAGPMSTTAWALARPEYRAGKIFPVPLQSASADHEQTAGLRWENPACGYDFASGVCKYLYAHADPVNNIDPSGEMTLGEIGIVSAKIGYLGAKTSFAVWQGYSRAKATIGLVQDVAMVTEALWDGLDDEDADIIGQILYDYAQSRLISQGIKIVSGAGGKALGFVGAQLNKSRITKAGIQKTRDWYKNHRAKWAGKTSGNPNYPVQYDKDGWPNFSQYLYQGGVNKVRIRMTGSRKADFDAADSQAGISEAWRKANGYTWHHSQKLGTMELVKSAAHNPGLGGAPHAGGAALWEQLYGQKYGP